MRTALGAAIGVAALIAALSANGAAPRGFSPVSFAAADAQHVWIAGTVPCRADWCTAIARSSDGGRHFDRVGAPPFPGQADAPQIVFADAHDGFAFLYGRALYATRDGGTSWQRTPFRVTALGASAGRVYAVSGRRLLSTRVGAGTWRATDLSFDPVDVAAVGRDVWVLGAAGNVEKLARSADASRSFTVGAGPCFAGLGGVIAPASAGTIWAFCPTGMMGGASRSTDGGRTFKYVSVPHCCVNAASLAPASGSVAVIAPNGAGIGLLRTTNGGLSWTRARAPRNATYSVKFLDARVGFALATVGAGRAALWKTTDAGASWHAVPIR